MGLVLLNFYLKNVNKIYFVIENCIWSFKNYLVWSQSYYYCIYYFYFSFPKHSLKNLFSAYTSYGCLFSLFFIIAIYSTFRWKKKKIHELCRYILNWKIRALICNFLEYIKQKGIFLIRMKESRKRVVIL